MGVWGADEKSWLDRVPLDVVSIAVMVLSMFLDGAYLRRYSYVGVIGVITAYGLNFAADFAVNKFGREFVRHRLNPNLGKWKGRLVWLLLLGEACAFYFSTAFSWREATLRMPDEPAWLRWTLALFAPVTLAFLGIGQAMRDGKLAKAKTERTASAPKPALVAIEQYPCKVCGQRFATSNARNGHMKAHSNGHKEKAEVVA